MFTMLIGLPGSGKTEIGKALIYETKNSVLLSSDDIRKDMFGDENTQGDPQVVFEEMRKRAQLALNDGKNVIYDATNVSRKKRKHLLTQLKNTGKKQAYIIFSKFETCVKRDKNRKRNVGEKIIKKILYSFQMPFYDEGWDEIQIIMNDEPYNLGDYNDWMDCQNDNPHHEGTIGDHVQRVYNIAVDDLAKCYNEETHQIVGDIKEKTLVAAACALHDIGKKFTKSFSNIYGEKTEIAHYYSHHNVGSYLALGYENVKFMSIEDLITVCWLVNVHMDPFFKTKYYESLQPTLKRMVDLLHKYDVEGA